MRLKCKWHAAEQRRTGIKIKIMIGKRNLINFKNPT